MRLIVVMLCLFAFVVPASAQVGCGDYLSITKSLNEKYHEFRRMAGISKNRMVEVFIHDNNESFTILIRKSDKFACLIASGKQVFHFEKKPRKLGKKM